MDTAINNGDFLIDSRNRPFLISDKEEILQQVLIRLTVKKGSFIYDPNLGSRLYEVNSFRGDIKNKVLSIVKEAVSPIAKVVVDDIELINNGENINLKVFLSIKDKKREVEIKLW